VLGIREVVDKLVRACVVMSKHTVFYRWVGTASRPRRVWVVLWSAAHLHTTSLCTFAYELVHYGGNTGHNRYMFLNSYILCMLKINMTAQTLLLLPVFYLDYFYTLELSAPGLVFFFSRYITTSGTFWITILIGVIGDYTGAHVNSGTLLTPAPIFRLHVVRWYSQPPLHQSLLY